MLSRRVALALTLAGLVAAPLPALAQAYPNKPIRLLVGYPPGGQTDQQTRQTATLLEAALKTTVVVENKPGAGTLIATRTLMESPPDGYTLLFNNSTIGAMPFLLKDAAGFDPTKSVTPLFSIVDAAGAIVVHKDVPANSIKEFMDWAKPQQNKLNYGSLGRSVTMIATENFLRLVGLKIQEIPYPGSAQYFTGIISGDVQMIVTGLTAALPQIREGKVKPLAVLHTSRVAELPNVPTAAEQGFPDVVLGGMNGIFGPPGMPADLIATIDKAVSEKAKDPEMKAMFEKIGGSFLAYRSSADYKAALTKEGALWIETAKAANIRPE
jgi:tripartite-type tricarboxylate transporter receptor subunit TctC